ncbi:MAG: hypoxanthine phosphoribosyltransferase [Thermodesulfobacteriota bacterium]|nr:hypoxanthine phosphoribosyltransferase [Thermodesulfobacteriota bacterium]
MEMELVVSRDDIEKRVRELGKEITKDFQGGKLVVVGILNGAFMFLADLVREIDLPLEVDFLRAASYGAGISSSGEIKITKDVELSIYDKEILIVEDLIDTGLTLATIKENLESRTSKSVRICALIDKTERREVDFKADYVGFEIKNGFLVGYGIDYAEKYRQYREVYRLQT